MTEINHSTKFTHASEREIVMTHVFDAPRELVWKVFTDPQLIPQWWGPASLSTWVEVMDLRPGGKWRFIQNDSNGNEFSFSGVYHEIVFPERLVQSIVMSGQEFLERVTMEQIGGKTGITEVFHFPSVEDRNMMLNSVMEEDTAEGLARLTLLLQEFL
jgi:uncharacterized protein YndB with AHSA1/START domain